MCVLRRPVGIESDAVNISNVRQSRHSRRDSHWLVSATTGQSPRAPGGGLGEQLNERFQATSLRLSSAGPGHERVSANGNFSVACWRIATCSRNGMNVRFIVLCQSQSTRRAPGILSNSEASANDAMTLTEPTTPNLSRGHASQAAKATEAPTTTGACTMNAP